MRELCSSPYFGIALSVLAFGIGVKLNEKLKTPVCNPLVIAIVLIVGVLLIFKIPYEDYNAGGKIINMFLAPATACLAVAIYTKIQILKQYWLPILVGCTAGSLASMGSVYGLCRLFGLDKKSDSFFAAEIRNNPDCREHIRTGRRRRSDYGCRRYRNRNTRGDICAPSYKII